MKLLISVGSTSFDRLVSKLMSEPFQKKLSEMGVTKLMVQNGYSKLDLSPFEKNFEIYQISSYSEYLKSIDECDFGISHCGKSALRIDWIKPNLRCWDYFGLFYVSKALDWNCE